MSDDAATDAELLLIAAGRGARMGGLTRDLPKALLSVEDGRSILEATLANLHRADRTVPTCVVGGHGWARLAAFCAGHPAGTIRAVFNPAHRSAGPATSILAGLAAIPPARRRILIGNGDTLFSTEALARALSAPPGIALIVSRTRTVAEDELRVETMTQRRIVRAAKAADAHAAGSASDGPAPAGMLSPEPVSPGLVSAGLAIAHGSDARATLARALSLVVVRERIEGRPLAWHTVFEVLATAGTAARAVEVPRDAWVEFDTEHCIARHAARRATGRTTPSRITLPHASG